MDNAATTVPAVDGRSATRELSFVFTGRGGEYFKIWIVNICLTVLTVGIYSAWAKVRTRRYFYRNTLLDGRGFDYHAAPIAILKGRLIAAVVLGGAYAAYWYDHRVGIALFALLFLLSPWVANQASRFNARMTSYRNVRFGFAGGYGRAFVVLCVWPILGMVSLAALTPLAARQRNAYLMGNYRFGDTPFSGKPTIGSFYDAYLVGVGLFMYVAIFAAVGASFAMLPAILGGGLHPMNPSGGAARNVVIVVYAIFALLLFIIVSLVAAKTRNAVFDALRLTQHRFRSSLSGWRYGGIVFTNLLLAVATLGLWIPLGQIRLARYIAAQTTMMAASDLSEFSSVGATQGSAAASELAVLEGLAIGLGT